MTESLSVPTATSFREIAVDVLDARRKALNGALAAGGKKISFTHLIGFAIAQAARTHRVMTQAFQEVEGKPYRLDPGGVNLGLAVDVERKDGTRGLVVPVIKGAETLDFAAFHATYEALVEKARTNKLLPDDFAGATITLTNPGTIGTVASVPRLMKGQGSIIATGAIRDVAGAKVMTITSTYDHRVIQGAESGMFLRAIDELLAGEPFYDDVARALGLGPGALGTAPPKPKAQGPSPSATAPSSIEELKHVAAAMALVRAFRSFGYLAAPLDPLGTPPPGDPALDPSRLGLNAEIMARIPSDVLRVYVPGRTLAEAIPALQQVWCGPIAYEVEHIASHEERIWLRQTIESGAHRPTLTAADQRRLHSRLTVVEALEEFLHKAYLGQKRFSIEGLDILVPMIEVAIDAVGAAGTGKAVLGMAHRGRLNVLAHIVNMPYDAIFEEFEGAHRAQHSDAPEGSTGDVKYHKGAEGTYHTTSGNTVAVTLAPNPSHLEAVNPVVEGRARAYQSDRSQRFKHDPSIALPILVHGDAAFAAQGVVGETFNLARLAGYTTGGTIHLITNNQVGFTTEPREGRSTDFASDLAKGFDVPIIHVNADDPEACLAAVRLAVLYRDKFHGDVVIDVVGYRRYGHNETDEPAYTQPAMSERIKQHPRVRQVYADRLAQAGVLDPATAAAEVEAAYQKLVQIQQALKESLGRPVQFEGPLVRPAMPEPDTGVPADRLRKLNAQLLAVPDGFTIHPKLKKQLERRLDALDDDRAASIEWAHGEALALASLLVEGTPVRLSGQDTARGTFSQRHLVLHDAKTGDRHAPIRHLAEARAAFELHNSPLSEYACLGFEYGYAIAAPEALVLWEAQFGDFANGAEIIIDDQFIFSGLAKWGQTSRLTLLLPHGYEGQGPEHSSARLERYLALGAEGNIRVANPTTPAQYFHLLRRQARHGELRPLVIMTPKSLLRLPAASSNLAELAAGRFQHTIDDPAVRDRARVTRLVLCSGKIYYDLLASPLRAQAAHVAIGRVEMLYPVPVDELKTLIASYPGLREVMWVQEEPRNMGARKFVQPRLREIVKDGVPVTEASRPERASPAEGYPAAHQAEQTRIVAEALHAP